MPLCYFKNRLGTIRIVQQHGNEPKRHYTIQIRNGNCLAVMIHSRKATPEELEKDPSGKYYHTLYGFFADEQHMKNIMKSNNGDCLYDKVTSIELNMYFKECKTLLKYFTMSGHKVTCYNKEP